MIQKNITLTVPTWAVPYLEKCDKSGLSVHEIELCENFREQYKIPEGWVNPVGEPFLSISNDLGVYSSECTEVVCLSLLTAADMHKILVCPVNTRYGAPMGRANQAPPSWEGIPCFDRRVPLDSSGYDQGGAYWGLGSPVRLRISKDFKYWEFYR